MLSERASELYGVGADERGGRVSGVRTLGRERTRERGAIWRGSGASRAGKREDERARERYRGVRRAGKSDGVREDERVLYIHGSASIYMRILIY